MLIPIKRDPISLLIVKTYLALVRVELIFADFNNNPK